MITAKNHDHVLPRERVGHRPQRWQVLALIVVMLLATGAVSITPTVTHKLISSCGL